jgi:HlyD family secretion protein
MKKNIIIGIGVAVVLLIAYFAVKGSKASEVADIITTVKQGTFRVEIETTGELEAKNSVKILGPARIRDFHIWQAAIQSIVDEGTLVKKGDWIATLDRSEFQNRYSNKQIELEKVTSRFVQTQLDTTLNLRQFRDDLVNLKYGVDERKIILEQSKYEPPATIKQAEISLDKAIRAYEQALDNYKIKKNQNIERMKEVAVELRKMKNELEEMNKVMEGFNVLAPEDGMIIYARGHDGRPMKAGSQVHMWEPTVATLPDLTKMISRTYVNEVDVSKVTVGQRVEIGIDAYPDKRLKGSVIRVANVGEQRPNADAKVFEVTVEIDGTDLTLRPAMTTSNKIIASVKDKALHIPLECLHSYHDTITYVYKKEGIKIIKQEVIIGETNTNEAVVVKGLKVDDRVYLSLPIGSLEDDDFALLPELNGKRKKNEAKDKSATQENQSQIPEGSHARQGKVNKESN